jgi:hypothetical protein
MWGNGKRGASEVLGAILVFAILVSSLAVFQTSVVPNQNEQVEFNGYDQARSDMVELNTQVVRTAGQGTQGSATVKTGVRYPARAFALNPGAPTGSVGLTSLASASIRNAEAVDPDAADYWDGSPRDFGTQRVVFRPAYNRFDADPVTATGSLVYRLPEGGSAIPSTEQTLVRGTRISLTAVRGDLSTAGQRVTLSTVPVSTATETVRVTGEGSNDIVLELPTDLSAAAWERVLAGQRGTGPNQNVESVSKSGGVVSIVLDGSKTYTLQLAKVEVRQQSDDPVVADANPAYVTGVTDERSTLTGGSARLEARVFDTFGNPVAGEEVTFRTGSGDGSLTETTVRTDDRGVAVTQYQAPADTETATVTAECGTCVGNAAASESEFTVEVSASPDDVNLPPTVEILDIRQTGNDPDEFEIVVSASDPNGDLSQLRFKLKDANADDSQADTNSIQTISDESRSVSGSGARVTVTLSPQDDTDTSNDLAEYHIAVVVTDSDGLENTVSVVTSGEE